MNNSTGPFFYVATYNGRTLDAFEAASLYAAHRQAVATFRAPKSRAHMVTAHLVAAGDRAIIHTPDT